MEVFACLLCYTSRRVLHGPQAAIKCPDSRTQAVHVARSNLPEDIPRYSKFLVYKLVVVLEASSLDQFWHGHLQTGCVMCFGLKVESHAQPKIISCLQQHCGTAQLAQPCTAATMQLMQQHCSNLWPVDFVSTPTCSISSVSMFDAHIECFPVLQVHIIWDPSTIAGGSPLLNGQGNDAGWIICLVT